MANHHNVLRIQHEAWIATVSVQDGSDPQHETVEIRGTFAATPEGTAGPTPAGFSPLLPHPWWLTVPKNWVSIWIGAMARRLGWEQAPGEDQLERVANCLTALLGRPDMLQEYDHGQGWNGMHKWCRRFGIPHEYGFFPGGVRYRRYRCHPIARQQRENSPFQRAMFLEFGMDNPFRPSGASYVIFEEAYLRPDSWHPSEHNSTISVPYPALPALLAECDWTPGRQQNPESLDQKPDPRQLLELEERLIAEFEQLLNQESLAPTAPRGEPSRLVQSWFSRPRIACKTQHSWRKHRILETPVSWQSLGSREQMSAMDVTIQTMHRNRRVKFTEWYGDPLLPGRCATYSIEIDYEPLLEGLERLERQLGLEPDPDHGWGPDCQIIRVFQSLADQGILHANLPMRSARQLVAELLREVGIPFVEQGFARQEVLVSESRATDASHFSIILTLDRSTPDRGIRFSENYEYYPRSGVEGREYGYTIVAGYSNLPRLVRYFQRLVDTGNSAHNPTGGEQVTTQQSVTQQTVAQQTVTKRDLAKRGDFPATASEADAAENALATCFRALLARGDLGSGLAIRGNLARVEKWFNAAGVDPVQDDWFWVDTNSLDS